MDAEAFLKEKEKISQAETIKRSNILDESYSSTLERAFADSREELVDEEGLHSEAQKAEAAVRIAEDFEIPDQLTISRLKRESDVEELFSDEKTFLERYGDYFNNPQYMKLVISKLYQGCKGDKSKKSIYFRDLENTLQRLDEVLQEMGDFEEGKQFDGNLAIAIADCLNSANNYFFQHDRKLKNRRQKLAFAVMSMLEGYAMKAGYGYANRCLETDAKMEESYRDVDFKDEKNIKKARNKAIKNLDILYGKYALIKMHIDEDMTLSVREKVTRKLNFFRIYERDFDLVDWYNSHVGKSMEEFGLNHKKAFWVLSDYKQLCTMDNILKDADERGLQEKEGFIKKQADHSMREGSNLNRSNRLDPSIDESLTQEQLAGIREIDSWVIRNMNNGGWLGRLVGSVKSDMTDLTSVLFSMTKRERLNVYYLIQTRERKNPDLNKVFTAQTFVPKLDAFKGQMLASKANLLKHATGGGYVYMTKLADAIRITRGQGGIIESIYKPEELVEENLQQAEADLEKLEAEKRKKPDNKEAEQKLKLKRLSVETKKFRIAFNKFRQLDMQSGKNEQDEEFKNKKEAAYRAAIDQLRVCAGVNDEALELIRDEVENNSVQLQKDNREDTQFTIAKSVLSYAYMPFSWFSEMAGNLVKLGNSGISAGFSGGYTVYLAANIIDEYCARRDSLSAGEKADYASNKLLSGGVRKYKHSEGIETMYSKVDLYYRATAENVRFELFKNKAGEKYAAYNKKKFDEWKEQYEKNKAASQLSEADKRKFDEAVKRMDGGAVPVMPAAVELKLDMINNGNDAA